MELVWTRSLEWIGGTLERWGPELVDGWIALGSLRWILVGLVAFMGVLWIVLGIRRAVRLRHGPPPELLLTRGTLRFVDTPRDPATGDRTDRFALRVALANLGERPVSIVELAILTEYAPDPVVIERVDALAPNGSVEVTADVVGPAGDHGTLEVYVTTPPRRPGGRPGLWRLEGTLSWEAWNARYRVEPLEQRVRAARSLPSSRQAVQDRGTWRRQQEALRVAADRGGREAASHSPDAHAAGSLPSERVAAAHDASAPTGSASFDGSPARAKPVPVSPPAPEFADGEPPPGEPPDGTPTAPEPSAAAASADPAPTGGRPFDAAPRPDETVRSAPAVREPASASPTAAEPAAEPASEPTASMPTAAEPAGTEPTSPEPANSEPARVAPSGPPEPNGADSGEGDREPIDARDLKLAADDLPPPVAALLADLRGAEGGSDGAAAGAAENAAENAAEDAAGEEALRTERISGAHATDEARDEEAERATGAGGDDPRPNERDTYYLRERIDLARLSGPGSDEAVAARSASDELPADGAQDDGASTERAAHDPGSNEARPRDPDGDRHARDPSVARSGDADGDRGRDDAPPPTSDAPRREPRPRLEFPDDF